jgi:N-formylglutamate amidohydrolase
MRSKCFSLLICFMLVLLAQAQEYEPGLSYFDEPGYIEYIAGNLPIIISVPHGGYLTPDEIPDRDCEACVTINDAYTQELGRALLQDIHARTGCYPHVIINRLRRAKLDANRDLEEAADGNIMAENAWFAYHDFIDTARIWVLSQFGKGLFIDLHGHGHAIQRLELGYLISKNELMLNDDVLNSDTYVNQSSLRNLVSENLGEQTHAALLRGSQSLGTIMEDKGYAAVPSTNEPAPASNEAYFSGGYNTHRYGSIEEGTIDAIQIECNQDVRFEEVPREVFADSLASGLLSFLDAHYFMGDLCNLTTLNELIIQEGSVYPNPACSELHFSNLGSVDKLQIWNSMGQCIRTYTQPHLESGILLENLPDGLYFLTGKRAGVLEYRMLFVKNCN